MNEREELLAGLIDDAFSVLQHDADETLAPEQYERDVLRKKFSARLSGVAQGATDCGDKSAYEAARQIIGYLEGNCGLSFSDVKRDDWDFVKKTIAVASPAQSSWQDIALAPGDVNVLLNYDGVVVIGGFNPISKEWTDGEDYIPLKKIRGWMPLPRTSQVPSTACAAAASENRREDETGNEYEARIGKLVTGTPAAAGHCWCGLHNHLRSQCDRCNQRGVFAQTQMATGPSGSSSTQSRDET